MLCFLVWNTQRKDLSSTVADICEEQSVDVLILIESGAPVGNLLRRLNEDRDAPFYELTCSYCDKVQIYTRFSDRFIDPVSEHSRWTIRQICLPDSPSFLLAALHFPGKREWNSGGQYALAREFARTIRAIEERKEIGHLRTLIAGDFNMNPFEEGMIGAFHLNAVMDRKVASGKSRRILGEDYLYFYNPTWSLLGDIIQGTGEARPPGSFYYIKANDPINTRWHAIDQLIMRPEIIRNFIPKEMRYITASKGKSLVDKNLRPLDNRFSDHLPLMFKFRFDSGAVR